MRLEGRATIQCVLPVRNVFDDKTVRLKIIAQNGGESRLVFDHEDPWPVQIRCAITPHNDPPITQIKELNQANILLWVRSTSSSKPVRRARNRIIDQHPVAVENDQLESGCRTLHCLIAQAGVEER